MKRLRLRVVLREVTPEVLRVVDVPADCRLDEVHWILQAAIGWTDSHLHQFVTDDAVYATPSEDEWQEVLDERRVPLKKLPSAFRYDYDFGDGWEHDVTVLGPGGETPGVVYGEGDCPPEDCGGVSGYAELLEVLADPSHEEHEHMTAWVGVRNHFNQPAADSLVKRTAGEVPASVRLILDLAADGVKLTPGGRLPRAFVRQVQAHRPQWAYGPRLASGEEDLFPLIQLHEVLREVGLLRLSKGLVAPTKVANSDVEIVRRLRGWFAKDLFTDLLVGDALAVLVTRGPLTDQALAKQVLPMLGGRWAMGGEPLTERDVEEAFGQLWGLLVTLDLLEPDDEILRAGPSAARLLVRATGLAEQLAN